MSDVILTVSPSPADSTVTLIAAGYTQVNNTITVPEGTEVSYMVQHNNYSTVSGTFTPNYTATISVALPKVISVNCNTVCENVAELLTNSVNMTTRYYDIFINSTPMDVTIYLYNDENELVPMTIPNRAKDRKIAITGTSNPEGVKAANVGSLYVNSTTQDCFIKTQGTGSTGWKQFVTEETWGNITGTLSNQTDLQNALDNKQGALVQDVASVTGTAITLDSKKGVYSKIVSANTTFTIDASGLESLTGKVISFELYINRTAGTITFPNTVAWSGSTPAFSSVGSYLVILKSFDGGSTWLGNCISQWT